MICCISFWKQIVLKFLLSVLHLLFVMDLLYIRTFIYREFIQLIVKFWNVNVTVPMSVPKCYCVFDRTFHDRFDYGCQSRFEIRIRGSFKSGFLKNLKPWCESYEILWTRMKVSKRIWPFLLEVGLKTIRNGQKRSGMMNGRKPSHRTYITVRSRFKSERETPFYYPRYNTKIICTQDIDQFCSSGLSQWSWR